MHIDIMHIWAYPSMSAWMCILVWAIPGRIWMNTGYCMTVLCQICIRMIIWKKPNSGYDYMHIRVLSGFISRIFDISGQHWFLPTQVGTWLTLAKDLGYGALPKSGQVSFEERKRKSLSWLRPHSWGFYWNRAYAQLCWNRIYCNNFTILARIKKIDQQLAW